jgi:sulfofructose kinase
MPRGRDDRHDGPQPATYRMEASDMALAPRFDVVGLGCCCWDLLGIVSRHPGPDEKMELLELIEQGGGLVATASVAVARLGGSVCYIGRIGSDDWGRKTAQGLTDEGVSIEGLQVMQGHTSQFAFCIVKPSTGQRAIVYQYGSWSPLGAGDISRDLVLSGRTLLLDSHHPKASVQAAKWAKAAGVPIVLDIEKQNPDTEELLSLGDYPIVPEEFAHEFGGSEDLAEAARAFLAYGPRAFVVTQGARGSTAFVDGEVIHQPAYAIDPVVDTTGAGDVFHGAFAYGLALGYDLRRNLRFSTAVAGLKCRKLGGRAGIPGMDEVRRLMGEG